MTGSLDDYLYQGMYPRIYKNHINPTKFYRDYLQTYVERDVRKMVNVKDLSLFQHFLKLCAGRIGQIFNAHSFSNELGVSQHTVKNWLSILEASFLVFRLQPYFENFGKRLIKSPKLYFTDVGLAAYLLDIVSVGQIVRDPLRGNLVENLIVSECMKNRLNKGIEPSLYYYRDSNQHEVDLLLKTGNALIPIEIKSSQTFNADFLKGLKYFHQLIGSRCPVGFLVYAGAQEQRVDNFYVYHYKNINQIFDYVDKNISA
jgi:predicted AAA+ superfamily ATPase